MAQENINSYSQLFEQALAKQQNKEWDSALELYQKILDQGLGQLTPAEGSVVYHNMSLVAHNKSDSMKAFIWSKKSMYLDPSNSSASESFQQFSAQVQIPQLSRQISNIENVKYLVSKASPDILWTLSLVLFLVTIWTCLKKVLETKRSQLAGDFSKKSSHISTYLFATLFIIFLSASMISQSVQKIPKALVIAEKAAVQTAPGENKPVIFEAQAGLEVEVIANEENFVQIKYPGAFSGWVNKSQIEQLSL